MITYFEQYTVMNDFHRNLTQKLIYWYFQIKFRISLLIIRIYSKKKSISNFSFCQKFAQFIMIIYFETHISILTKISLNS